MSRRTTLSDLLHSLFSDDEFRRFLRDELESEGISKLLPGSAASYTTVVSDTVDALERRGLIDQKFFDLLERERPRRTEEIRRARANWFGEATLDIRASGRGDIQLEPKKRRIYWRFAATGGILALACLLWWAKFVPMAAPPDILESGATWEPSDTATSESSSSGTSDETENLSGSDTSGEDIGGLVAFPCNYNEERETGRCLRRCTSNMVFVPDLELCVDRTEVTVSSYMNCHLKNPKDCGLPLTVQDSSGGTRGGPLCNTAKIRTQRMHPINCVSHAAAEAYCKRRGARLPTWNEWTRFAGSQNDPPAPIPETERIYPWGNESIDCRRAHYMQCKPRRTVAVASIYGGHNFLGIADLAGNVWEWTNTADTKDGMEVWVVAGGSWRNSVSKSSNWFKIGHIAHFQREVRGDDIGFRCVTKAMPRPQSKSP